MNTTERYFHDGNAQNLSRIKQRKEHCFTQAMSADENDQDDDLIAPIAFQDYRPQVYPSKAIPPVEACVPICAILSKKSEKYQPQDIQGLNRRFEKGVRRTVSFSFSFLCW